MSIRVFALVLAGLLLLFAVGCFGFFMGQHSVEGVQISAEKSVIAEQPQAVTQQSSNGDTMPNADKININDATMEQLIELPGIGEATAKKILDYRDENGSFTSVEQLLNVSGIGEKKLQAIRDYITVLGG